MSGAHDHEAEPNDPTRSGSPLPHGKDARLSQNEIEQLCLKAARGAGMSWGMAEEAGFSAAWLSTRGLDGPGALLAQLQDAGGRPWHELCPVISPGHFRATDGGCLCPIALGAALCDHARLPQAATITAPLRVGPVNHPVLLLPFLSAFAMAQKKSVRLEWRWGVVVLGADGHVSGDARLLARETSIEAELTCVNNTNGPNLQMGELPILSSATLSALNELALRTTVAASEASRAGAGTIAGDND